MSQSIEQAPAPPLRDPGLGIAATYRRTIAASLERVWENVLDWEHLPYLHHTSFSSIERIDSGAWGWRAKTGFPGGVEGTVELLVDREASRYRTAVLDGPGAGVEIWTSLEGVAPRETAIVVEFCVRDPGGRDLSGLGQAYEGLYARLWDEDEAMMRHRQTELDRLRRRGEVRKPEASIPALELGPLEALRASLPLRVELGERQFLVVESEPGGELLALHASCPHWHGPLGPENVTGARVVCPWHGYAFDLRTGESCDGRGLRLAAPPRVEIDRDTGAVRLIPR